jgi:hypothetical protein
MPAAKAFAESAILNELSRTHIHTTYMYVYAGLVHIFLYIYIFNKWRKVHATPCNTPLTNACNTLQHTCNTPTTNIIQQVEESACNTLQHTCNKCVLYELPLFHRESSVMDAYAQRHHCS